MTDRPARILTVDDDADCQIFLRVMLTRAGYEVIQMSRGDRIIQAIETHKPDLVVTDIIMPGVTGGVVYQMIRQKIGPGLPIVVSSGSSLKMRDTDCLVAFCPKPINPPVFLETIASLLAKAARPGPATEPPPPVSEMEDLD